MQLDKARIKPELALLETMINRGRDIFYTNLEKFLKRRGLDITEFNPYDLIEGSDDDNIFLKPSILNVDGFDDFVNANNMVIAMKYNDKVVLKPINNNAGVNLNGSFMYYFDSMFHNSELYHLAPSSARNTILRLGLRPKAQKFGETNRGFETYDPRIYLIVKDQVDVYDKYGRDINMAIAILLTGFKNRYPGSGPYDIWKVTLPENIELHRDASFKCGAYIKNALPPKFLELAIENVSV